MTQRWRKSLLKTAFAFLVDIEYNNRKNNSLKRLIKSTGFDQSEAYTADINYTSGRKLNRILIERLATSPSIGICSLPALLEAETLYGLCVRNGSLQAALQD